MISQKKSLDSNTTTVVAKAPGIRAAEKSADLQIHASDLPLGNPMLGIASVVLGFLLVTMTFPESVEPRRALVLPALLFAICLCVAPLVSAFHNIKAIFRAEHILVMSPIFWLLLDPIQGRYDLPGVGSKDVRYAFLATALFVASAWLGCLARPWGVPNFLRFASLRELSPALFFSIGMLAFALAFLRFAIPSKFDIPLMFNAMGDQRWAAPWGRGDLGGADAFLDHFSYFGYILPCLTVVLAKRIGWFKFRTLCLGLASLIIASFLAQGGGRRIIGVLFASAAVLWFLWQPKVRWRSVMILLLLMIGLLAFLETMLDYRNIGFASLFDPSLREEQDSTAEKDVMIRIDDNFLRLAQVTSIFPERHPYTTWHYVLFIVARPVPRLFWPGKPINAGFDLPEFVDITGASLSPSVIGELFIAGGFIGVMLGGWFYGRIASALSRLLAETGTPSALLMYSIGLLAIFAGMRSMIELVLMSYGILAWAALIWLTAGAKRKWKKKTT